MGNVLSEFSRGAGEAVSAVAHLPGDVAAGIGSVVKHSGDIIKGTQQTAEFIVEHPRKTLEIAGAVGLHMLKAQLDPKQMAINAGLIALTVATAGAAAPAAGAAFAGEAIEGAAVATEAVSATTEAVAATTAAAKGVQTGATVAENATTAAKVADDAANAVKLADEVGTATEAGTEAVNAGEAGEAAAKTGGRLAQFEKFASKGDRLLKPGEGMLNKVMHPLEAPISGLRSQMATKILEGAGEEAPSLLRQTAAAVVQGIGRQAPEQLPGMTDEAFEAQKMAWRAGRIATRANQVQKVDEAAKFAADPEKALLNKADEKYGDRVHQTGYYDPGQTAPDMYSGGSSQVANNMYSSGSSQVAGDSSSQVATDRSSQVQGGGAMGFGAAAKGVASAAGRLAWANVPGASNAQKINEVAGRLRPRGQHFWDGANREPFGGIQSSYDWRTIQPLRKTGVEAGFDRDRDKERGWEGENRSATSVGSDTSSDSSADSQSTWNAPLYGAPEMSSDGNFAMSTGQNPIGSEMPKMLGPASSLKNTPSDRMKKAPVTVGYGNVMDSYQGGGQFMGMDFTALTQPASTNAPTPAFSQGSRTSRRKAGGNPIAFNRIGNTLAGQSTSDAVLGI